MRTTEEKGICIVVAAGDFCTEKFVRPKKGDLLLAADAGLRHLEKIGVQADIFIGDADSLGYRPESIHSVLLPERKDDTDLAAALRCGLEKGYRRFLLYGALGGTRFSHSLANVQLLGFLAENGAVGEIVSESCRVRLILAGETRLLPKENGFFSLFAFGGEAIVSIAGAKYPLCRTRVIPSFPLCVSNAYLSGEATVTVHSGKMLLVTEPE